MQSGKRSYPSAYVNKSFKTQHSRIPIDPAILSAVEHVPQQTKIKLKGPVKSVFTKLYFFVFLYWLVWIKNNFKCFFFFGRVDY